MRIGKTNLRRGAFGQPSVPFLLSRRAHLFTTPKGRWYFLRKPCALRGGCGFCGSLMDNATTLRSCCHCPRSYRKHIRFCVCEQGYNLYPTLRQLPVKNINLMFFTAMGIASPATPIFFLRKRNKNKERKDSGNEWRFIIWKQRWSAEVRGALRLPLPLI